MALIVLAAPPARAGAPPATLSARARPARLTFGRQTKIAGALAGPGGSGGVQVSLAAAPYAYRSFHPVATATTRPGGAYSFSVRPQRNTRYRVRVSGAPSTRSPIVGVTVDERVSSHAHPIRGGSVRLTIRSGHPADLRWGGHKVVWYLGTGDRGALRRVKVTRSGTIRPNETLLRASVRVRSE